MVAAVFKDLAPGELPGEWALHLVRLAYRYFTPTNSRLKNSVLPGSKMNEPTSELDREFCDLRRLRRTKMATLVHRGLFRTTCTDVADAMLIHTDRLRLNHVVFACTLLLFANSTVVRAGDKPAEPLPFAADTISRLSLDGKPRSLAVRQGADVWLGYDLERATVFKAWQASPGTPGLSKSGFTTRSKGKSLFEDTTDAGWELRRGEKPVPLKVRYLGCSHRKDHVELRWELSHDSVSVKLYEHVPLAEPPAADRAVRELRGDGLASDDELSPPAAIRKAWKLSDETGIPAAALRGAAWHRLVLP